MSDITFTKNYKNQEDDYDEIYDLRIVYRGDGGDYRDAKVNFNDRQRALDVLNPIVEL